MELLEMSLLSLRNPQRGGNWVDFKSLTNSHSVRGGNSNNHDGRLNTECEINNRSAANLRSLNVPSTIGTYTHTVLAYPNFKVLHRLFKLLFPLLQSANTTGIPLITK